MFLLKENFPFIESQKLLLERTFELIVSSNGNGRRGDWSDCPTNTRRSRCVRHMWKPCWDTHTPSPSVLAGIPRGASLWVLRLSRLISGLLRQKGGGKPLTGPILTVHYSLEKVTWLAHITWGTEYNKPESQVRLFSVSLGLLEVGLSSWDEWQCVCNEWLVNQDFQGQGCVSVCVRVGVGKEATWGLLPV